MRLLIFGLGFCGNAAARMACATGWQVVATTRSPRPSTLPGLRIVAFDAAGPDIGWATHLLATAPPRPDAAAPPCPDAAAPPCEAQDPVLARFAPEIAAASGLAWIGYLSTTGVYGDRAGGWVDETTEPAPRAERSHRRLAAEQAWRAAAAGRPLDLCRLAGIYGPGRSAFDDLRAGQARRVIRPGHAFGRTHVEDIAAGLMAAMARPQAGTRVLNFSDDVPAESAAVTQYAAELLGLPVPPAVPFDQAEAGMSAMARSFWADNRRVSSAATQAALGLRWRYPSYREGLAAILAAEQRADRPL